MERGTGEPGGRGIDLDELPAGSVVYVSRGSFRMEAVGADGELVGQDGTVQPMTGMITAPYGRRADGENTGVDRLPVSSTFRAPDLQSLFGSQVDVPVLAAPTGTFTPRRAAGLRLPGFALAILGGALFAWGFLMGEATRRADPPPAIPAAPQRTAAPVAPEIEPVTQAAPEERAAPVIEVAAPVKITTHKRPAARAVVPRPPRAAPAAPKPWLDPFAD
jgi:hypothetical protein